MTKTNAISLLILVSVIIFRVLYDVYNSIEYHYEEAQYWVWSQNLSLSYLTKGPLVSWSIYLSNEIFGQNYLGLKFFSLLALIATILLLGFIAEELSSDKDSRLHGIVLAALSPAIFFLGGVSTTDIFLFFFWSLFLFGYIRFLKTRDENWFYLIGLATGFGLLTKLSMILLPLSIVVYSAFTPLKKYLFSTKFFSSIAIALLIFSPVLIWNYLNNWPTISHEISHLAAPATSANPEVVIFSMLLIAPTSIFVLRRNFFDHIRLELNKHILIPMVLIFIFFFVKALFGKVQVNWSMPLFIVLIPIIAAFVKEIKFSFMPGLVLIISISIFSNLGFSKVFTDNDPLHPMRGWKAVFEDLNLKRNYSVFASNDYKLLSQASYYLKDAKNLKYDRNPSFRMTHYDTWNNKFSDADNIIYLTYENKRIVNKDLDCILTSSSNIDLRKNLSLYTCKKK